MADIVMIRTELDKITKRSIEERFPGHVALRFARFAADLDPIFKDFATHRTNLVERLGEPTEAGDGNFRIPADNVKEFNDEINKMLAIEVEFKPTVTFKESDVEAIKLDILEAMALLPYIKD
jgi:hypothetical protein